METKLPPGRPRPLDVIQRDNAVLNLLISVGTMTRTQIHAALGLDHGDKTKVYLSLSRLRREGKVRLCQGAAGDRVWTADVDQPCP